MDAYAILHEYIYMDETGFSLTKTRNRGRNVIGRRAFNRVPWQHVENLTMCAAILQNGFLPHHATLWQQYPHVHFPGTNSGFLLVPDQNLDQEQPRYVVIWENVTFHQAVLMQNWFATLQCFIVVYHIHLFINSVAYFFSLLCWKVYDH